MGLIRLSVQSPYNGSAKIAATGPSSPDSAQGVGAGCLGSTQRNPDLFARVWSGPDQRCSRAPPPLRRIRKNPNIRR
jgi:hypothetical protein